MYLGFKRNQGVAVKKIFNVFWPCISVAYTIYFSWIAATNQGWMQRLYIVLAIVWFGILVLDLDTKRMRREIKRLEAELAEMEQKNLW